MTGRRVQQNTKSLVWSVACQVLFCSFLVSVAWVNAQDSDGNAGINYTFKRHADPGVVTIAHNNGVDLFAANAKSDPSSMIW